VTPSGKSGKVGTVVATPALPVNGADVGAWMCEAVVVPNKPLKDTITLKVWAESLKNTSAVPVPGDAGASSAPDKLAVYSNTAPWAVRATRTAGNMASSAWRFIIAYEQGWVSDYSAISMLTAKLLALSDAKYLEPITC